MESGTDFISIPNAFLEHLIETLRLVKEYFYMSMGDNDVYQVRKYHYAISKDGINWDKPDLGLYVGDGETNIVFDPSKNPSVENTDGLMHVIRDEIEQDPSRRYKGLFGCNIFLKDRKVGKPSKVRESCKKVNPGARPLTEKPIESGCANR